MTDFEQERAKHRLLDAEVVSTRPTARGYFELTLTAPGIAESVRPGQFAHVRCRDAWVPLLRRPLSILRADPRADSLSLLIQIAGEGTELLSRARPGERLSVLGPLGNWFVPAARKRHLLVCGGVGVVPMLPFAQHLTRSHGSEGSDVRLLYGAADGELFSCLDDFRATGCSIGLSTDDGSRGHHGFVTDLLEQELGAESGDCAVYVCGPMPMMVKCAEITERLGVPCQISLESQMGCGMGVCLGCVIEVRNQDASYRRVCRDGPVFDASDVVWEAVPHV